MTGQLHTSPDGILTFVIERLDDGNVLLGFLQSQWHTHAHFLVPDWGVTGAEAVQAYTDALLTGVSVIGVLRKNDAVAYVWIMEDPAFESHMAGEGETLEMRYWDGRPWAGSGTAPAMEI